MSHYNKQEIFENVKEIFSNCLHTDPSEISEDSHIYNDLKMDDLDMIEVLSTIEGVMGVEIKNSDSISFANVKDVVDYVTSK